MNLPSVPTLLRLALAAIFLGLALLVAALRAGAQAPSENESPAPLGQSAADSAEHEADDADDVGSSRATSFRAVDGAVTEDVPGGLMVVGAYGAIFALLLLFLLRQRSQLHELDSRITGLRAEIERGASRNGNHRE